MKKTIIKKITKSLIVLLGISTLTAFVYHHYEVSPWTRHGFVRSDVVELAPQVNGSIVDVCVSHNSFVKKGDVLFYIDPEPFQLKVDLAKTQLDEARKFVRTLQASIETMKARYDSAISVYTHAQKTLRRIEKLYASKTVSAQELDDAKESCSKAKAGSMAALANLNEATARLGKKGEKNARVRMAKVALDQAELDLERTVVRSPVDGFTVNVRITKGDYVAVGKPALSLVDADSVHVIGAFKETQLKNIHPGAKAVITLMTNPDVSYEGTVRNIGTAIDPKEYSTGNNLIPRIPAVFDWIRLAQRVPVIIDFVALPKDTPLVIGTTSSISINGA